MRHDGKVADIVEGMNGHGNPGAALGERGAGN
jgi:hypothetical protein